MIFSAIDMAQTNNLGFGANLIIKNPEVKTLMRICDDKVYTKKVFDEFVKIEP